MGVNLDKLKAAWDKVVADVGIVRAWATLVAAHPIAFAIVFGAGFLLGVVLV